MVIRFCISISMFILNSNFFRYVLVTRDLHQWCPRGGHRNWVQFKNQMQIKDQILLLTLYIRYWFQTSSDMLGQQKNYINGTIVPSLYSSDLGTTYRPDTKWESDFVSQFLCVILNSNFVRYVGVTRDLHQWCPHDGHLTRKQFRD